MLRFTRLVPIGLLLFATSVAPAGTARVPSGHASGVRPAAVELRDLESLEAFASLFNEDTGVPRIVLLLSPT